MPTTGQQAPVFWVSVALIIGLPLAVFAQQGEQMGFVPIFIASDAAMHPPHAIVQRLVRRVLFVICALAPCFQSLRESVEVVCWPAQPLALASGGDEQPNSPTKSLAGVTTNRSLNSN